MSVVITPAERNDAIHATHRSVHRVKFVTIFTEFDLNGRVSSCI